MPNPDFQPITFQNVVVGVDGGAGGRDAVTLATALMEPGGRLILATVVRPRGATRMAAQFADADRQAAAHVLEVARKRLDGPVATEVIVHGSIAGGLHSLVERHGADLLVVGSAHRGALGRVLLGDDARQVLNGAHSAVAVAPLQPQVSPCWHTIAVGDDGSAESALALACARRLAARLSAQVRVCSVVGPAALTYRELSRTDSSDAIERRIFEERTRLARYSGVETDVLEGDAGEALAELSGGVDLIVIGSRGQGPWGRLMTGSTGEYLARHGRCPLLILPRALSASAASAPDGPSPDPRGPAVAAS